MAGDATCLGMCTREQRRLLISCTPEALGCFSVRPHLGARSSRARVPGTGGWNETSRPEGRGPSWTKGLTPPAEPSGLLSFLAPNTLPEATPVNSTATLRSWGSGWHISDTLGETGSRLVCGPSKLGLGFI